MASLEWQLTFIATCLIYGTMLAWTVYLFTEYENSDDLLKEIHEWDAEIFNQVESSKQHRNPPQQQLRDRRGGWDYRHEDMRDFDHHPQPNDE